MQNIATRQLTDSALVRACQHIMLQIKNNVDKMYKRLSQNDYEDYFKIIGIL